MFVSFFVLFFEEKFVLSWSHLIYLSFAVELRAASASTPSLASTRASGNLSHLVLMGVEGLIAVCCFCFKAC